jgi:hypothetical protein
MVPKRESYIVNSKIRNREGQFGSPLVENNPQGGLTVDGVGAGKQEVACAQVFLRELVLVVEVFIGAG